MAVVILPVVRSASAWAAFAALTQVVGPLLCVLAWCLIVALALIRKTVDLDHFQELEVVLGHEHLITRRWRRRRAWISTRNGLEINVQVLSAALLKLCVSLVWNSVGGVHTMCAVSMHWIVRILAERLLALMKELIWVKTFTRLSMTSVVLRISTRVIVHLRTNIIALVVLTSAPLIEALRLVLTICLQVLIGWACQKNSEVALDLLCG
jgi:hypothetical protein